MKVQLADKHKEFAFVAPKSKDFHFTMPNPRPDIDIPAINMVVVTSSARSGLMVENITPQLGEFFGVKNGNGVLVRSVEKGSRAEKAGFRAGDVIVKVNEEQVNDTSDFTHAVRSRNGNSVKVGVMRDKKEQTFTLSLPEKKESGNLQEEESYSDNPLIQAQTELELSKLRSDLMAKLQPEFEVAKENSRKAAEQMRQALRKEQKEFCQQTEKQREQMRKNMESLRKELQQMKQDWI